MLRSKIHWPKGKSEPLSIRDLFFDDDDELSFPNTESRFREEFFASIPPHPLSWTAQDEENANSSETKTKKEWKYVLHFEK